MKTAEVKNLWKDSFWQENGCEYCESVVVPDAESELLFFCEGCQMFVSNLEIYYEEKTNENQV